MNVYPGMRSIFLLPGSTKRVVTKGIKNVKPPSWRSLGDGFSGTQDNL